MYTQDVEPWEQPSTPSMTSYSISRTALRFFAIAGASFTVAVLAQSVPPSLSWSLLGVGAVAWVASIGAALIKKGDDTWAMVGVTAFGVFGALVGIGEILSKLPWNGLALPAIAVSLILVLLIGIERLISRHSRQKEVSREAEFY